MSKNRNSPGIFKILCILVLMAPVLSEAFLQFYALKFNPYSSHSEFLDFIQKRLNSKPKSKVLYFVGDSFLYGTGSSEKQNGPVERFCSELNRKSKLEFRCHNLGYPGSSTEDHIQVLKRLREKSRVFLLTGANNSWNIRENFTFHIFGKEIEFKTLKFLHARFPALFDVSIDSREMIRALDMVIQKRNLSVYHLSYPFARHPLPQIPKKEPYLDLFKAFERAEMTEDGMLQTKYLSTDLSHPNDLGYLFYADFLLKALEKNKDFEIQSFSTRKNLGLLPFLKKTRSQLDKELIEISHQRIFSSCAGMDCSTNQANLNLENIRRLESIRQKTYLLREQGKLGMETYRLASERLLFFFYHQPRIGIEKVKAMMVRYVKGKISKKELRQCAELLRVSNAFYIDDRDKQIALLKSYSKSLALPFETPAYLLDGIDQPFPLEYCQDFSKDFHLQELNLSIRKDFELVFRKSLSQYKTKFRPRRCFRN